MNSRALSASLLCLSLLILLYFFPVHSLPVIPHHEPPHPVGHPLHHPPSEMNILLSMLPPSIRHSLESDAGFLPAFVQSFLLILACEIGDRTFFVAAILAMKSSRVVVWTGALTALAAMTVLSAAIGKAFPLLMDKKYTSIAAAVLFLYFGLQLLREWWKMRASTDASDELAEVEEELKGDSAKKNEFRMSPSNVISPIFVKALTMTALAEWGDRSQIATIALAASRHFYGVVLGGIVGHALCTGLAVIGGRLLAARISERIVALVGGIVFVMFAVLTAFGFAD